MASIAYIEQRIAGKEKEIAKLTKKLDRITAAQATGWTKNPYYYDESDLRSTAKELDEAKTGLAKYQAELTAANEKAASRNVPAILEFLEAWKQRCFDFYNEDLHAAFQERDEIRALYRRNGASAYSSEEAAAREKAYRTKLYGRYERVTAERNGRKYTTEIKAEDGEWEHIRPLMRGTYEESAERLKQDLAEEANRKYDFIIERTNEIVGEITDATGLKVGAKGDLNGYIKGTRGTAKVKTIGAGGYNIQCYHFRTLIHAA